MNQLIVFLKNPQLGKVKTRLAADIGDELALKAYQKMTAHTLEVSQESISDVTIYWSHHLPAELRSNLGGFRQKVQAQSDLGHRMQSAMAQELKLGATAVIGSDCLALSSLVINEAFDQLGRHDVVIGPAMDGGFYLLAMKEMHSELFLESYSHAEVLEDTLAKVKSLGLSVHLLPMLSDIDTLSDLEAHLSDLGMDIDTWINRA